jgi:hypothetical protein
MSSNGRNRHEHHECRTDYHVFGADELAGINAILSKSDVYYKQAKRKTRTRRANSHFGTEFDELA